MSLRVWLPLNKDLRNNGLENVTVTNNGGVLYNSAYRFQNANDYVYINKKCCDLFNDGDSFSLACWIYLFAYPNSYRGLLDCTKYTSESTTVNGQTVHGGGIGICLINNGAYMSFNPLESSDNRIGLGEIPLNTWTHICVSYDKNTRTRFGYVNGKLKFQSISNDIWGANGAIFLFGCGSQGGWNYVADNMIYDARIYNHALSLKEVKELAKGLYLHYTFNDPYIESTNNYTQYRTIIGHGSNWTLQTEKFQEHDIYKNIVTSPNTGNNAGFSIPSSMKITNPPGLNTATSLTISFYKRLNTVYGTYGGYGIERQSYIAVVKSDNTTSQISLSDKWNNNNWGSDPNSIGEWEYITGTVTIPTGCTAIYFYIYRDNAPSGDCDFSMIQLEAKDHATPYTPSYRTTTILPDNSGFGNDGTIVGDLHVLQDSNRGFYSTYFNGNAITYFTDNLPLLHSYSFWVYIDSYPTATNVILMTDYNSHLAFGFWGGDYIIVYAKTSNQIGALYSKNIISLNKWNHVVGVYYGENNENIDIYVNGVKQSSVGQEFFRIGYASLSIGGRANGTFEPNTPFIGKLSDFRIYKTALSVSDVLDLYKSTFIIDDTQKSYCYELNESDSTSQVKLTEAGIAKCKNFSESITSVFDDTEYIEPDGSVWIRIFHHNNPNSSSRLFSKTDSFTTNVYKDADRWFNVSLCNKVSKWEFLVKEKETSSSTEFKCRWIQTANPMSATLNNTTSANITQITTTGYSQMTSGFGGLYKADTATYDKTYLTQNSGSINWSGAIGCWTGYGTSIPAVRVVNGPNSISTGYLDLYLRIDNLDEGTDTKIIENGSLTSNELIEL